MRRATAGLVIVGVGAALWRRLRVDEGSVYIPSPEPAQGTGQVAPAPASASAPAPAPDLEPSRKDLYARAQELGIQGRSKMSKEELRHAIEARG